MAKFLTMISLAVASTAVTGANIALTSSFVPRLNDYASGLETIKHNQQNAVDRTVTAQAAVQLTNGWALIKDFLDNDSCRNLSPSSANIRAVKIGECVNGLKFFYVLHDVETDETFGFKFEFYANANCTGAVDTESSKTVSLPVPVPCTDAGNTFRSVGYLSSWAQVVYYAKQQHATIQKVFPSQWSCLMGTYWGWGHIGAAIQFADKCIPGDDDDTDTEEGPTPSKVLGCEWSGYSLTVHFAKYASAQTTCAESALEAHQSVTYAQAICQEDPEFGGYASYVCH